MTEQKKTRAIIITIIIILSMISFVPLTQSKDNAAIIYVDTGRDASWYNATKVRTISEGINNVTAGGTIYIYDGTYTEDIVINKTATMIGNSSTTVFLRPASTGSSSKTIDVQANNVNISHMNITGAEYGLYMNEFENIIIDNCDFNRTLSHSNININNGGIVIITNSTLILNAHSGKIVSNDIVSTDITLMNNTFRVNTYGSYENYFYVNSSNDVIIDGNNFSGCNLYIQLRYADYIISNNTFSFAGIDFSGVYPPSEITMNNNTINGTQILFVQDTSSYTFENNHSSVQVIFMDVGNVTINNVSFLPTGSYIPMISTGLCGNVSISNISETGFNNKFFHDSIFDDNVSIRNINIDSTSIHGMLNPIFRTSGIGGRYVMDNITHNLQPTGESSSFFLGAGNDGYSKLRSYYISNITLYNTTVFAMFWEYPLHSVYIDNVTAPDGGFHFVGFIDNANNITIKNIVCSKFLSFLTHMVRSDGLLNNTYIHNVTFTDGSSDPLFDIRCKNLLIENFIYTGDEDTETLFNLADNSSNITIRDSNFTVDFGERNNVFLALDTWTDNVSLDNITVIGVAYGIEADEIILENLSVNNSLFQTDYDNVNIYTPDGNDFSFTNNTFRCIDTEFIDLLCIAGGLNCINNVNVKNNTFISTTEEGISGVYFEFINEMNFSNNNLTQGNLGGISFWYIENATIYNNHIEAENGVYFSEVNNITTSNNHIIYSDTGIFIDTGRDVVIDNEILTSSDSGDEQGIAVITSDYITISDCNISGIHQYGISICDSSKTTIHDNLMLLEAEPEGFLNCIGIYISGICVGVPLSHHLVYGNNITFSESAGDSCGISIEEEDNVTIRNNEINYASYPSISIIASSYTFTLNNTIRGTNTVLSQECGVYISGGLVATYHIVGYNNITHTNYGVYVVAENEVIIRNNEINYASYPSILIIGSSYTYTLNNTIKGTNTAPSDEYGVYIQGALGDTYHTVGYNNITHTNYGVYVEDENEVIIRNNFIDGIYAAIDLVSTVHINITNNQIKNSYYGILMDGAYIGIIHTNFITGNDFGLFIHEADDYLIYNNYFYNSQNVCNNSRVGINTWNVSKTSGQSIVGGPYLGGNYWSDYAGSDADGDGLGDTPYGIESCPV